MSVAAVLIDTAGPCVGVAARNAGGVVFSQVERIVAGADGWLTPALARALVHVGAGPFSLGVSTGPGAFTGVRVGLAHALGLAVARGMDLVPLSSLAVRAAFVPGHRSVLAVLDGKKGRVYAQRFDTTGPVPLALDAPQDVDPLVIAAGEGVAVGEGAVVYAAVLATRGFRPVASAERLDLASALPLLAGSPRVAPVDVRPVYLREPDAVPPPGIAS